MLFYIYNKSLFEGGTMSFDDFLTCIAIAIFVLQLGSIVYMVRGQDTPFHRGFCDGMGLGFVKRWMKRRFGKES